MPIRVFVYGSLKKGLGNHRLLEQSKFLGRCYIEGRFKLLNLGGFPGLVKKDDLPVMKVVGEVYQINEDTLRSLDWLEGHPRFYERSKVPTPWKNAWTYFLPPSYLGKYSEVESIWRPTDEEKEWFKGVENPTTSEATSCGSSHI
jgi:gamma-glutamylaminecyclotransferase